jgi:hypothetical protein
VNTGAEDRPKARQRPIDLAWAALPVLLPVIAALATRMRAIDLAYHVRLGEQILSTHALPRTDSFTFSVPGRSWVDQQWLAQVALALLHRGGAWGTLLVGRAALSAGAFLFVFLACRAVGLATRTSSLLTLAGFVVAVPVLAMRPQLLAVLLFSIALWAVMGRRHHPARLWVLPAVTLFAANVHGSFPLFVLLGFLAWIEDAWGATASTNSRRTLLIAIVTAGVTLLTPFGVGTWRYALDISTSPTIRDTVSEWAPLTVRDPAGALTFVSVLSVAAYFARRRRAVPWNSLLWLAAFLVPAFVTQRAIVWWCLVAPVVVATLLAQTPDDEAPAVERRDEARAPAVALVGALVLVTLLLLPWWRSADAADLLKDAPTGLTAAVQRDVPAGGTLFVHQPWASWFEQALPDDPVFVDSRIELYPPAVWTDYGQIAFAGAGWRDVLNRWHPDAIVADKAEWDLIPFLRADPQWRVAYEDADGVLFVRA